MARTVGDIHHLAACAHADRATATNDHEIAKTLRLHHRSMTALGHSRRGRQGRHIHRLPNCI